MTIVFTLLAQFFAHIMFLGIFLPAYYGYNRETTLTDSTLTQESVNLAVFFTPIQIVGIGIQVLTARLLIIKRYEHDPLKLCHYLIKHARYLFTLLVSCVTLPVTSVQSRV